jgi:hypothetical protein
LFGNLLSLVQMNLGPAFPGPTYRKSPGRQA